VYRPKLCDDDDDDDDAAVIHPKYDDMYTCNIGTGAARVKSERDAAAIGGAAHS